ncbi:diaminobutyrate--2-oxoglutarate transaminase [Bradyrhizobium cenepequi]|uniref:diaminobutyrate--2-oxoglutarate transaminase n=1 Tax=Bradyrhizobium cenepequi TaxID=2821403 RepID=UPI001CE39051|nr:diaminobutyrate--2-oxoglutarate transaminase [Bradyrhizobium cenepequi]MCA6107054.1 diaminobutyrate--2-oxoglutarate transaminase [Bradyrhizobium cenepequi]
MSFDPASHVKTRRSTVFERRESRVRSYALSFPTKFVRASGAYLYGSDNREYLDFLSGCSSLNYGHNHPILKDALMSYIARDGLAHSLDMETDSKEAFLEEFETTILHRRDLDYVVQFPGPTGANAVEAALKIARKATGRSNVIAFTNSFHGCSLGALALTGNALHRCGSGVGLDNVTRMPFDQYFGGDVDTSTYLDKMLTDPSGGVDAPAAFIVETVQGEGGLNAASFEWLREIERIARKHGACFIIDDVQAGIGRTGTFFSFEPAGVKPDIVVLAKSVSGYGLPMALTLLRRDLDIWKRGEHSGTFRGNCHAFVTAKAALERFWRDDAFEKSVRRKGQILKDRLQAVAGQYNGKIARVKGRSMMRGLDVKSGAVADKIVRRCFDNGLIVETSGADNEVVKCLAPLTIGERDLEKGLDILADAAHAALADRTKAEVAA